MSEDVDYQSELLDRLLAKTKAGTVKWVDSDLPGTYIWSGSNGGIVIARRGDLRCVAAVNDRFATTVDTIQPISEYGERLEELWSLAAQSAGAGERFIAELLEELGDP